MEQRIRHRFYEWHQHYHNALKQVDPGNSWDCKHGVSMFYSYLFVTLHARDLISCMSSVGHRNGIEMGRVGGISYGQISGKDSLEPSSDSPFDLKSHMREWISSICCKRGPKVGIL